jgi:hypothetical protein
MEPDSYPVYGGGGSECGEGGRIGSGCIPNKFPTVFASLIKNKIFRNNCELEQGTENEPATAILNWGPETLLNELYLAS